MTGDDFRRFAIDLFGEWGWQTRAARWLGVDKSTARRWTSGEAEVPGPVVRAINGLNKFRRIAALANGGAKMTAAELRRCLGEIAEVAGSEVVEPVER